MAKIKQESRWDIVRKNLCFAMLVWIVIRDHYTNSEVLYALKVILYDFIKFLTNLL